MELQLQGGGGALGWSYSFRLEVELQGGGGASGWSCSFRVEGDLQGGAPAVAPGLTLSDFSCH